MFTKIRFSTSIEELVVTFHTTTEVWAVVNQVGEVLPALVNAPMEIKEQYFDAAISEWTRLVS